MTDLIQRIEAGGPGEQRALLIDAFGELHRDKGGAETVEKSMRFSKLILAEAYVDAALMLVPADMADEMDLITLYQVARVGINLNHGPDDGPYYGENRCNVKALAIASASLRAGDGE